MRTQVDLCFFFNRQVKIKACVFPKINVETGQVASICYSERIKMTHIMLSRYVKRVKSGEMNTDCRGFSSGNVTEVSQFII